MPSNGSGSTTHIQQNLPGGPPEKSHERFREFDLQGKVFAVTGGGRGLGLAMAEALVEAGGEVHCLDRLEEPDQEFLTAQERADPQFGGSLHYRHIDVRNSDNLDETMGAIASLNGRLDGLIAAAGINHVEKAVDHSTADIEEVMNINYTGVFMAATAAAKQMFKWKCRGSIMLVASMSGLIANKGMISPVYNSSKAAVMQLGRSLAMEWGKVDKDGKGGIRVNCLCPGHIMTAMVEKVLKEDPESKKIWEAENMLGRLARPEEFRAAALFLLSDASSFMTGSSLVIDGGHTAW
ncbi:hypothetical protein FQN54_009503 [Arachnomyces sp. PD_36]|nr:hypothetical protein FQN54_009503 [Arachnomyces sp. PD_36]